MVRSVDVAVEGIVDALKAKYMWKNTVLIYHSDNGGALEVEASNGPLHGNKGDILDGGIRVPAFIHGPHVPAATWGDDRFVSATDMLPTILEVISAGRSTYNLAGKDVPFDGAGLWPELQKRGASWLENRRVRQSHVAPGSLQGRRQARWARKNAGSSGRPREIVLDPLHFITRGPNTFETAAEGYMYVCTSIHPYKHTYTYIYTYIHTYICISYIHTYICMYHTCMSYIHMYVCMCMYVL
jgi:hypothetical protein